MNNNARKHGHCGNGSESPTYRSWKAMKRRCRSFGPYQSVEIAPEWFRFDNFLRDMGERPEGTTLDRRDGAKGYSKENCRWATRYEQNQNRKDVVLNEDKAREILSLQNSGLTANELANLYSCSACNVRDIWAKRAWGNL